MGVTDFVDYVPTLPNSCKRLGAAKDGWGPRERNGALPSGSYLGWHCRSCAVNPSVDVQSVPVGSHRHFTTMPENRHQGKRITAYA